MNRAKIIVETSPYWHYTIDYMMSSIEAAGFSAIELWTAAPHYCFADAPEAMKGRRAEICDCAKAHGLTIPVFSPEQMVKSSEPAGSTWTVLLNKTGSAVLLISVSWHSRLPKQG